MGAVDQKILATNFQLLYRTGAERLDFRDVGFRTFSEHDEDGILLFIFALIGAASRHCIEIGAGNGIECNTANLIVNHRWIGELFDASQENVNRGRSFYSSNQDTRIWPPRFVQTWITRSNINELIRENTIAGPVDLLSIDLDGVDYWIWKELTCIRPRVVVLEFNQILGPEDGLTVPYHSEFKISADGNYFGASLSAFVKLGKEKGYHLVGTNRICTNAFFVSNEITHSWLPEITTHQCEGFSHPRAVSGMGTRLDSIKSKPWVKV